MYELERFTKKAAMSIAKANTGAELLGHTYVGSEHLLLGILAEGGSTASAILNASGINEKTVTSRMITLIGKGNI